MTIRFAAFASCAWLALAGAALADGRDAVEILKDYDAVTMPKCEPAKKDEPGYVREYREAYGRADRRKSEIALELFHAQPANPRLPEMLLDRWKNTMMSRKTAAATVAEIDAALPYFKDRARIKVARHMRVIATIQAHRDDPEKAMPELDQFLADYPKDPLGANLLGGFASTVSDPALKVRLLKRLIETFPDQPAARAAEASLAVMEKVGKPFTLAFRDAIKGQPVSIEGLKGKVVVLDFWATWCGPCVAEMPKMKALYAKYRTQGVEFIGVSLDQPEDEGGLARLRNFVAKNEIPWPQHYDGKAWDGPLIEELGIRMIPAVFLIDADGNLASIDARGKLETLIPEQLARARKASVSRSTSRGSTSEVK